MFEFAVRRLRNIVGLRMSFSGIFINQYFVLPLILVPGIEKGSTMTYPDKQSLAAIMKQRTQGRSVHCVPFLRINSFDFAPFCNLCIANDLFHLCNGDLRWIKFPLSLSLSGLGRGLCFLLCVIGGSCNEGRCKEADDTVGWLSFSPRREEHTCRIWRILHFTSIMN